MAAREVEFAQVSFTAPGGHCILREISLRAAAGTTTALLGRSGSGKTTLLRAVNGLVRPTAGRVLVRGRDVAAMDGKALVSLRRGVGYVIQETGLFPHMTLARNVGISLDLAGTDKGEAAALCLEMLALVELDASMATRYPWQLSGGQRQRAGLARALAAEPSVLLMDEPFGALDPITRAEMQTMLRPLLKRLGVTTILVTHDLDEALYLADRVVLLEQGSVVAEMAADEVLASANPAMQAYVAATTRVRDTGPGAPGILREPA
ncbi:osmoprotectant transport system ATP-binding protein [Bryocella elongata]|uniref:Osmoprotectant transport system ATP-binding protein n=1 Tax=Bryocella elongata TaxID=863522 RepID=A0A1H5SZ79_9BACT|nr:ATP-binding cassette domain-containing protein [Bryocella elongata]SEF55922.1 osmoprotectant transport system ATP-binding protein [Bryocella elongata]